MLRQGLPGIALLHRGEGDRDRCFRCFGKVFQVWLISMEGDRNRCPRCFGNMILTLEHNSVVATVFPSAQLCL